MKYCGLICAAKEIHSILVGDDVGQEERGTADFMPPEAFAKSPV